MMLTLMKMKVSHTKTVDKTTKEILKHIKPQSNSRGSSSASMSKLTT